MFGVSNNERAYKKLINPEPYRGSLDYIVHVFEAKWRHRWVLGSFSHFVKKSRKSEVLVISLKTRQKWNFGDSAIKTLCLA